MEMDLAQQAVSAALEGNWEKAIQINTKILDTNPQDTDALNRLARAYSERGNLVKAKRYVKMVLKIDPVNSIALRAWEKWRYLKKGDTIPLTPTNAESFIEEPGKTKIADLINLGDPKILAKIDAGDEVRFNPHGHRVSIISCDGKYIGRLPDDLGAKLKNLIKMGNEYKVIIKCNETKDVKVFIKEISSCNKGVAGPSFTSERIDYVAFTPPELVHKKDDISASMVEEED
ncbi:MAG TPA: tetratricopeptide repeat protein [Patescibacteria group bacterium]|nr:tetratricopeptide repeat protein [Patescibacteria group bacterium]